MRSIFNFQFSIFNYKRGFTLVELLVVIAIIASTLTITVGIATSTLRGTNKTNVINKVRENGSYAISQMIRMIKYAKSLDGASVDGVTDWTCDLVPAPTPVPVQYKAVRISSFEGVTTTFSCETNTINSNGASLMDTGPSGSVSLSPGSCFFTCRKENIVDSPTIGINFTLNSKSTSGVVETTFSIPFEASIKIRN